MSFIQTIKDKFNDYNQQLVSYLMNGGINDLFQKLISSKQYPYFFLVQATWCCYAVKNSKNNKKSSFLSKFLEFFEALFMTFFSREIIAYMAKSKSPILQNPNTLAIFAVIWIVINFSPFDIGYKLVNFFSILLCPLEAVNQIRLGYRYIARINPSLISYKFPQVFLSVFLITFIEPIIQNLFSLLSKQRKTMPMTSFFTLLVDAASLAIYLSVRYTTPLTKYTGKFEKKLSTVVYALALAIYAYARQTFYVMKSYALGSSQKKEENQEIPQNSKKYTGPNVCEMIDLGTQTIESNFQ